MDLHSWLVSRKCAWIFHLAGWWSPYRWRYSLCSVFVKYLKCCTLSVGRAEGDIWHNPRVRKGKLVQRGDMDDEKDEWGTGVMITSRVKVVSIDAITVDNHCVNAFYSCHSFWLMRAKALWIMQYVPCFHETNHQQEAQNPHVQSWLQRYDA